MEKPYQGVGITIFSYSGLAFWTPDPSWRQSRTEPVTGRSEAVYSFIWNYYHTKWKSRPEKLPWTSSRLQEKFNWDDGHPTYGLSSPNFSYCRITSSLLPQSGTQVPWKLPCIPSMKQGNYDCLSHPSAAMQSWHSLVSMGKLQKEKCYRMWLTVALPQLPWAVSSSSISL